MKQFFSVVAIYLKWWFLNPLNLYILTMEKTICGAIDSGKCLEFEYEEFRRVLNPFILYRSQDGETLIEGDQVEGKSESSSMPYWRSFRVDRIDSIEIVEGPQPVHGSDKIMPNTEEKYNPNHERYAELICAKNPIE